MQVSHVGRGGVLVGALLGGALLLGACGSSGTPASNTGGGSTTTTAPANTGGGSSTTTAGGGSSSTTSSVAGGGSGLDALAQSLQNGQTQSYDATYKVTNSNGQTESVEYASSPPSNYAVSVTNAGGNAQYIGTAAHSYACNQKSGGGAWSCFDLGTSGLGAYAGLVQLYQGKFWYQDVVAIKAYAGLAGFKVSTSTRSLAGQSLNCVSWSGGPTGQNSGGEVCVTTSGILGYVHAEAGNTTFELQSLSTSPPASKFQPPAGATITSMPGGSIP